jgi:hypothetical protein
MSNATKALMNQAESNFVAVSRPIMGDRGKMERKPSTCYPSYYLNWNALVKGLNSEKKSVTSGSIIPRVWASAAKMP